MMGEANRRGRWLVVAIVFGSAILAACSPRTEPRPPRWRPCPDRGEGLRIVIAEQITIPASGPEIPSRIENRYPERVERIRYFTGWFDGSTEPTLDEMSRVEQQLEITFEPGESKSSAIPMIRPYLRGDTSICLGNRAVPVTLGHRRLSFTEA